MTNPIDQAARTALLRRIARGDRAAVADLADLYDAAGYAPIAASWRKAVASDHLWAVARDNAASQLRRD